MCRYFSKFFCLRVYSKNFGSVSHYLRGLVKEWVRVICCCTLLECLTWTPSHKTVHSLWFSVIFFTSGSEIFHFWANFFLLQLCFEHVEGVNFHILMFTQAISHIFCICLHWNCPNPIMVNFWQVLLIGLFSMIISCQTWLIEI